MAKVVMKMESLRHAVLRDVMIGPSFAIAMRSSGEGGN